VAQLLNDFILITTSDKEKERCTMWIGIIILGYFIGVLLLIRFLQAVHHWDDEIEAMENQSRNANKKSVVDYRPAL
jgi:hypothetical protein